MLCHAMFFFSFLLQEISFTWKFVYLKTQILLFMWHLLQVDSLSISMLIVELIFLFMSVIYLSLIKNVQLYGRSEVDMRFLHTVGLTTQQQVKIAQFFLFINTYFAFWYLPKYKIHTIVYTIAESMW